jgi:hypothetical protein
VFRETQTGFMHVVYREVAIRFRHGLPKKTWRSILRKHGLKVRRPNPFIPDQVIAYDPSRGHSGEELLEVSNDMSEMEEVVFAPRTSSRSSSAKRRLRSGPKSGTCATPAEAGRRRAKT